MRQCGNGTAARALVPVALVTGRNLWGHGQIAAMRPRFDF